MGKDVEVVQTKYNYRNFQPRDPDMDYAGEFCIQTSTSRVVVSRDGLWVFGGGGVR